MARRIIFAEGRNTSYWESDGIDNRVELDEVVKLYFVPRTADRPTNLNLDNDPHYVAEPQRRNIGLQPYGVIKDSEDIKWLDTTTRLSSRSKMLARISNPKAVHPNASCVGFMVEVLTGADADVLRRSEALSVCGDFFQSYWWALLVGVVVWWLV